jgi:hypothetical protein
MLIIVLLIVMSTSVVGAQSTWTSVRTALPDGITVPTVELPLTARDIPDSSLIFAVAPVPFGLLSVWQTAMAMYVGGFPVGMASRKVGAWTDLDAGLFVTDTVRTGLICALAPNLRAAGASGYDWLISFHIHAGLQWSIDSSTTLALTVQNATLIPASDQRRTTPILRLAMGKALTDWNLYLGLSMIAGHGLNVTGTAQLTVSDAATVFAGLETIPGALRVGILLMDIQRLTVSLDYIVGIGLRPTASTSWVL